MRQYIGAGLRYSSARCGRAQKSACRCRCQSLRSARELASPSCVCTEEAQHAITVCLCHPSFCSWMASSSRACDRQSWRSLTCTQRASCRRRRRPCLRSKPDGRRAQRMQQQLLSWGCIGQTYRVTTHSSSGASNARCGCKIAGQPIVNAARQRRCSAYAAGSDI